jgi:hypothetical protein
MKDADLGLCMVISKLEKENKLIDVLEERR